MTRAMSMIPTFRLVEELILVSAYCPALHASCAKYRPAPADRSVAHGHSKARGRRLQGEEVGLVHTVEPAHVRNPGTHDPPIKTTKMRKCPIRSCAKIRRRKERLGTAHRSRAA